MTRDQTLNEAVRCYIDRKARDIHPDGTFDRHGAWFPSATERQPCCDGVSQPEAKYPYPLMQHCRTIYHIAHLYKLEELDLRRAINQFQHETGYIIAKGDYREAAVRQFEREDAAHLQAVPGHIP